MARLYEIRSLAEAQTYLKHPLLGSRLRECAHALLRLDGLSAEEIFGGIDAVKLRSSMTLFAHAASRENVFAQVLDMYFEGSSDELTEQRLRAEP